MFQEQNAIRNVAAYSKSKTHEEMLQHIPRAEHIRQCCSIFQEQNAIRNVAPFSKSWTQFEI
jgi:hypothetical protein